NSCAVRLPTFSARSQALFMKCTYRFFSPWRLAVAWGLAAFSIAGEAGATEVRVRFQGPNHEPIRIKRAQLLLVNWGFTDQIDLATEGNLLRLPLDPSWVQSRRIEEGPPRFGVSIYVRADGYAEEPTSEEGYLTTFLTSSETVVRIHRLQRRPLS